MAVAGSINKWVRVSGILGNRAAANQQVESVSTSISNDCTVYSWGDIKRHKIDHENFLFKVQINWVLVPAVRYSPSL